MRSKLLRWWHLRAKWKLSRLINRVEQFNIRVFVVSLKRLDRWIINLGRKNW